LKRHFLVLSRLKDSGLIAGLGRSFAFLPADAWTAIGLVFGLASAWSVFTGNYATGAVLLLLSAAADEIDGAVARATHTTHFGAFIDSVTDRLVDGFVLAALIPRFPVAVLALIFSYMVSYTRARAECFVKKCDVGIGERAERIIVLIAGLIIGRIEAALWLVAALAGVTTLWRIEHARRIL